MSKLKLSPDLALPLEIASQAVAILGIRGAGKTNTASAFAEELLAQGQPIVAIDPTDAWWGLRSGFPVFIFGGPHGDLPLQESDGKVLAEFVVVEQVPCILSLRHLRKNAQRRFVTTFCEELYHLKGQPEHRTPLTVLIDEAPLFIPQRVSGDIARSVGAVEDLIARGRNSGFGVVLISQRSATINKDVLTQCDTIIAHRLPSPQDRKALKEWIEENATIEEQGEVLASLAKLPNGRAWVWSPRLDVMKQVQMRLRHTFDSSATPKRGEKPAAPKRLEEVDIGKLKQKLAAAVAEAEANDPTKLRHHIVALERELEKARAVAPAAAVDPEALQREYERGHNDGFVACANQIQPLAGFVAERFGEVRAAMALVDSAAGALEEALKTPALKAPAIARTAARAPAGVDRSPRTQSRPVDEMRNSAYSAPGPVKGAEQRILDALAELEILRVSQPERVQVAFLAGYSNLNSKGLVNALGALRTGGLIDYPASGRVALTDAGRARAQAPRVPRDSAEIQERVIGLLGGAAGRLLRPLIDAYPRSLDREKLAAAAGYGNLNSKGFVNAIGRLRSLGFIDYPERGQVAALPVLFIA